jgi:hypothetical protein
MEKKIEKLKNFRLYLLHHINELTTEQLNKIPGGHNNNIVWNMAHLICVQQNLCYVRSGLPILVEDKYFTPYMPGTKPGAFVNDDEIETIKKLFISTIDSLQNDLDKKIFQNYTASVMIPKVYGFQVNNMDDALEYLLYHEGFHGGCISSLKHLV